MIVEPWFQDNTELFDVLLKGEESFVMCVYPPGSGKSTIAELLKYYLSTNGIPEEISNFLNNCQFQHKENDLVQNDPLYKKFRSSASYVLFADFSEVTGETYHELEQNYTIYMETCWKSCGLPEESLNREFKTLETIDGSVWTSLLRLRDRIALIMGNLYIILDSIDNMYNLIANLPSQESEKLYKRFTKGISGIVGKNASSIKTFCFGVSPYLITEYMKSGISYHFIGSKPNKVGKYFSYSDESIKHMISKWNLKVSIDQCKDVAALNYNDNCFVNPYLCISYMRSLKENCAKFKVNLSPRSLWMKCIFTEKDLNMLYDVFLGEKKCQFAMAVSMGMMCGLSESSEHRKLYYPLFVFGGFLSCKKLTGEKDTYLLSSANETSKILIRHHLEALHYEKFKIAHPECRKFLQDYLNGNFSCYCRNLSKLITAQSSYIIKEERPYHAFMSGILSPLMFDNWEVQFDKEFGSVKPDAYLKKDNKIILDEYKHVIPGKYSPKKALLAVKRDAHGKILNEFYKPLEEYDKSKIVTLCRTAATDGRNQLSKYAPQFSSQHRKDVEVNIIIFYLAHVILIHSKYLFKTCKFSKYEIFSSDGYFTNDDLTSILGEP